MSIEVTAVLFILTGLLSIIVAIPMMKGKVKPNAWYGIRMPITQKSDAMWYPTNAYAGKGLVVVGVIVLVTAVIIPPPIVPSFFGGGIASLPCAGGPSGRGGRGP